MASITHNQDIGAHVRSRVEQAIAQAEHISRRKGYPPGGRLIILMARQLLRQYGTDAARWPRR